MDIAIFIILILLTLLIIFCMYKMLEKRGLYFALVLMNLITLVLSFKIMDIQKMNINASIISYIPCISIIYIFVTKYGYKEIKNLLKITLLSGYTASLLLVVMNYFLPAITETISINMQGTFEYNYKILIIYPIIISISIYISTKLYQLITQLQNNIIVSVMLTYIISGLFYTIVYYILAYINIIQVKYSLYIGVTTYISGLLITLINTILITSLVNKKVKK